MTRKTIRRGIALVLLFNFLQSLIIPTLVSNYDVLTDSALFAKASNNGPNAPEAAGFEPMDATDMVNLPTGDMSYVLPLAEIDGFPITLSYHGGIPMDMESSWVGLGWNINTGAIARGLSSTPDDWNGGKSFNIYYQLYETRSYTVNASVGLGKAAEVGIGLSWGSNKSLTGTVSASVGGVSANISSDGSYSIGVSPTSILGGGMNNPFGESSKAMSMKDVFGGSLSISGNVKGGGIAVGANAGYSNSGMTVGMGVSISGNGIGGGYSIGAGGNNKNNSGMSSGAGASFGSFSSADYDVSTSGFYIPIKIGIFGFGFGYQKQEIKLKKLYSKLGYGILYNNSNNLYQTDTSNPTHDNQYEDYQNKYIYGDSYEQEIPQPEEDFISDFRDKMEKVNFTYAAYDSYEVNATGLSGNMTPALHEDNLLIGSGFTGKSTRDSDKQMDIYFHNSKSGAIPTIKGTKNLNSKNLYFYFKGQVVDNQAISGLLSNLNSTSANNINDIVNHNGSFASRARSGTFVEVFTNSQIDGGNTGLMTPYQLQKDNSNRSNKDYPSEGIGGYKITSPDGKTYHFAQPVYHMEQVQHSWLVENEGASYTDPRNRNETRQVTPYATHWLLTAITGPDFVDKNNNNYPDKGDYGYYLRLDHGQWTNAYTWRTPYDKDLTQTADASNYARTKNYNTFIESDIIKKDPGHYMFGRKEIYYLNKIVSNTQTAYFVKDLRKDGEGQPMKYQFTVSGGFDDEGADSGTPENPYCSISYPKEYQLNLKEIVIVPNDFANFDETHGSILGSISYQPLSNRYGTSSSNINAMFRNGLPDEFQDFRMHQVDNVLDINDNISYENASQVIEFNTNYQLAKNTPNSSAVEKGRLTLNEVNFYGQGKTAYMPPYTFDYINPNFQYQPDNLGSTPGSEYFYGLKAKDNWGFIKGTNGNTNRLLTPNDQGYADPANWTLNKITTPQGTTIELEYEEDDFYIEAFARKYWQDNLMFRVEDAGDFYNIRMRNFVNAPGQVFIDDFSNYFDLGERVYLDLWICRHWERWPHTDDWASFNLNGEHVVNVISVNQDEVLFQVGKQNDIMNGNTYSQIFGPRNDFFAKASGYGGTGYQEKPRGYCPSDQADGENDHTMTYKLLANKVPPGTDGGGLKVTHIKVNNNSQTYDTFYDYTFPDSNGKSSGITSFNPTYGDVFVPYQNELPGPGVMYEYVTVTNSSSNNVLSSSRYHHYTLQPVFDIFNPEIIMRDIDGNEIFKTTIDQEIENNASDQELEGKEITITKDMSRIGQLKSIEQFNSKGQLMSKTENKYKTQEKRFGETFYSMKSIFDYEKDNEDGSISNRQLQKRSVSISRKIDLDTQLEEVTNYLQDGISKVVYSEPDDFTGMYQTSTTTMTNDMKIITTKTPAYQKYPTMGSKVLNINNKNMLTQEAYNVTTHLKPEQSPQLVSASATTWHNKWNYNLPNGTTESSTGIWRKHKNFIWKGDIDENGYYSSTGFTPFTFWNAGQTIASSAQQDINANAAGWEKVSEVTRYTPYSTPVETKDINGNFASSKMDNKYQYVLLGGNAKQRDMHARGFEDIENNTGSLAIPYGMQVTTAHTGEYGVQLNSGQSIAGTPNLTVNSNKSNIDATTIGDYKASLWFLLDCDELDDLHNSAAFKTVLNYGGNDIYPDDYEYVKAGRWLQLNYFLTEDNNNKVDQNGGVSIKNVSDRSIIIDDFRFHPIESSVASYNYDALGRLQSIIGANGFGSWYVYDEAGRLCSVYTETADKGDVGGGFKKVSDFKQNYANQADVDCNGAPPEPELCIIKGVDWGLKDCGGLFKIAYVDKVVGGSGDFTYQWSWIEDDRTATQTNPDFIAVPTQSNNIQHIPFARDFIPEQNPEGIGACPIDSENGLNQYKKYWRVRLELIDNQIGGIVYTDELMLYNTSDCFTPKSIGFEEYTCEDLNCNSNERHMLVFYDPHMTGSIENPLGVDRFDNYRFALYGTSNIIPNFSHFIGIGETCIPCTAEQIKTYQFLNDNQVNFALTNMECDTSHVERINYYEQETSTVPYIIDHYEKRSNKEVYQKNYEIKK